MTREELELAKELLVVEINLYIKEFKEILRISKNSHVYLEKDKPTFIKQISKVNSIEISCRQCISDLEKGMKKLASTRIKEFVKGEFNLVYDSDEDVRFMEERIYNTKEHKEYFKNIHYSSMSQIYFYTRKKGR